MYKKDESHMGPDYVVVIWLDRHGVNILPDNDPGIAVHTKDGQPGHGDVVEFLLFYRTRRRDSVKVSFEGSKWAEILQGGEQYFILGRGNRVQRVTICENAPISNIPVPYKIELMTDEKGPCGEGDNPEMIIQR